MLPEEQQTGIKNYVVQKIVSLSSSEESMGAERVFLNKMNLVLVQILKHEWPHRWTDFITELVNLSQSNEIVCENNMQILKLLSEEVFEVKDQMTSAKTSTLKNALNQEFVNIFNLCQMVLNVSQRPSLLNTTLQTNQTVDAYLLPQASAYSLPEELVVVLVALTLGLKGQSGAQDPQQRKRGQQRRARERNVHGFNELGLHRDTNHAERYKLTRQGLGLRCKCCLN